ncbi:cell division ATP-binding protein FtsE [Acetonema longum]|uniref:Cell division ATP-binding protein FtsE n=1 Tax=Acetonema longum DSM 6540 TaxID=1009370 RepID=F7NNY2_9FIRM|nr:cell division ATP-binding protein FtsE [Acetonema longum]EGO62316.1 cell division ATP-binding protein FtsE [Acetonema longum DSM 6540]
MIYMGNVSKIYETGAVALSNISVEIKSGEFVFVVGPSGAGKSTFIKLITREELPTNGQIAIGGHNLLSLNPAQVPYYRRQLGIVFQDYRLLPNKTVFENVAFAMEVIEATRSEIMHRVIHVVDLVGLRQKMNRYPQELSGGEQQRVAIARAIVNDPVVLVADEPTGNLDPDTSWEIARILEDINRSGTTIIMASHDKSVVDKLRRRVLAFEKGRLVRDQVRGVYGYEN